MIDRRTFLNLAAASIATTSIASCSGAERRPAVGVPRSPFDEHSTAEEVTAGADLSGKLAVVTGCTSGIGFETMRVLAMRGAWVVGTSRALQRAEAACARVRGTTTALQLELSDYESVIACANAIRSINLPLDILICNAVDANSSTVLKNTSGLTTWAIRCSLTVCWVVCTCPCRGEL